MQTSGDWSIGSQLDPMHRRTEYETAPATASQVTTMLVVLTPSASTLVGAGSSDVSGGVSGVHIPSGGELGVTDAMREMREKRPLRTDARNPRPPSHANARS